MVLIIDKVYIDGQCGSCRKVSWSDRTIVLVTMNLASTFKLETLRNKLQLKFYLYPYMQNILPIYVYYIYWETSTFEARTLIL